MKLTTQNIKSLLPKASSIRYYGNDIMMKLGKLKKSEFRAMDYTYFVHEAYTKHRDSIDYFNHCPLLKEYTLDLHYCDQTGEITGIIRNAK